MHNLPKHLQTLNFLDITNPEINYINDIGCDFNVVGWNVQAIIIHSEVIEITYIIPSLNVVIETNQIGKYPHPEIKRVSPLQSENQLWITLLIQR